MSHFKNIKDKIKNLKANKIIDVVFVAIFVILLFIPLLKIDRKNDVLVRENREMAKWVPIISEKSEINYNFGKDFENWYKDRFYLRSKIVNLYTDFRYKLAKTCYYFNNNFINKKTNYMIDIQYFNQPDDDTYLENYIDNHKEVLWNLKKLEDFCKENNIKFYIMISPGKNEIGSKLSYPILQKHKTYLRVIKIIGEIKKQTGIEVMYPYYELTHTNSKYEPLYFKADYHWNDIGAHVAYLKLMNSVKKDIKDIKVNQLEDFDTFKSNHVRVCPVYGFFEGRYYNDLNLNDEKVLDTQYTYLVPKNKKNIYESHKSHGQDGYIRNIYKNNNNPNSPNLFMFGDSYSLSLLPSLVSTFHNTKSIFVWGVDDEELKQRFDISRFEKEILDSKTDVLFILFCDIERLKYLYKSSGN